MTDDYVYICCDISSLGPLGPLQAATIVSINQREEEEKKMPTDSL